MRLSFKTFERKLATYRELITTIENNRWEASERSGADTALKLVEINATVRRKLLRLERQLLNAYLSAQRESGWVEGA